MNTFFKYEFNSARNALRVLVRDFKIKKIHLPFYLCPAVKNALRLEGCETEFYHIDKNFYPLKDFNADDFVLYSNYFGICENNVKILAEKYPKLIVDNAHAFYSPFFGFASVNSCRKFFFHSFGVKDGAVLRVKAPISLSFPKDKEEYPQIINDFSYTSLLKNEKRVDEFDIMTISECSRKILSKIDFEKEKNERRQRFLELDKKYKEINELHFELSDSEVPFVYPLLTRDENLQKELTKNNDLILRYWTNLPETFPEYEFYKYLLPLPLTNLTNHC
ncbi:hypothetical protein IKQ26_05145 [bacterium]|nr:hypothetical protein [bacterium]